MLLSRFLTNLFVVRLVQSIKQKASYSVLIKRAISLFDGSHLEKTFRLAGAGMGQSMDVEHD